MALAICPNCRAPHPSGWLYCGNCGWSGDDDPEPAAFDAVGTSDHQTVVDLTAWAGFKFGFGFALGVSLVSVIAALFAAAIFSMSLSHVIAR